MCEALLSEAYGQVQQRRTHTQRRKNEPQNKSMKVTQRVNKNAEGCGKSKLGCSVQ